MNVIRFDIEISFPLTARERLHRPLQKRPLFKRLADMIPLPTRPVIIESIREQFGRCSNDPANYLQEIKKKWDGLTALKIKSLYPSQCVVGAINIKNIEGFVFNADALCNKDKLTL